MTNEYFLNGLRSQYTLSCTASIIKKLLKNYKEYIINSNISEVYVSKDVFDILSSYETLPFETIDFKPDDKLKNDEFAFTKSSEIINTIDKLYD
jgi:hypothetical protein